MRNSKGFTLIELLVVIAIIGVLSSVILASLGSARTKAQDARRLSDAHQLAVAMALAADANGGTYPAAQYAVCLGTTGSCWGGLIPNGNAAINSLLSQFITIPADPTRTSGKGDRFLYAGPDSIVAKYCNNVEYPSGPFILWVPDNTNPTTAAACKNVGFYACCGTVTCPANYYCAFPI